jgi:hypothetical protein
MKVTFPHTITYLLPQKVYGMLKVGILRIHSKNDALLNMKHDSEYVREVCERILRNKYL